jgi:hypothetical protein
MKLKYLTINEYSMLKERLFFSNIENIKSKKTSFGITKIIAGSAVWVVDSDLYERFLKEIDHAIDNSK